MPNITQLLKERPGLYNWLRGDKKFPHMWCPGCGLGTILGAVTRVLISQEYDKNDVAVVSGIGCTGRIPVYLDCNTLHTTHGRALTFATGIKMVKPHMKVIVFMGDGDALAIGGNHFIHSCRRNIDITAVVVNNNIYGMTGGQYSPTTPRGEKATTARYGNIESPFDTCELAQAAGASYVARSTAFHVKQVEKLFTEALDHKGFSVLEIVSNCHTAYGKINKRGSHIDMLKAFKDRAAIYKPGFDVAASRDAGKDIITGVFRHEDNGDEYCELYENVIVKNARKS